MPYTGVYRSPMERRPAPTAPTYRGGTFGMEQDYGMRGDAFSGAMNAYNQQNQNQWDATARDNQNQFDWASRHDQNQWDAFNQQKNSFTNSKNSLIVGASGLTTQANKDQARGDLQTSLGDWARLRDTGGITPEEFNRQVLARTNRINAAAESATKNFNATLASRGLGGNAGAAAALGNQAMFAAAGERGLAEADLESERRAAKERGIQGYSGVSSQLADIALTPTQEAALALLSQLEGAGPNGEWGGGAGPPAPAAMPAAQRPTGGGAGGVVDIWNQFRNANPGPDSWNPASQQAPVRPQYPTRPGYDGGVGDPWNKPIDYKPITWRGR